MHCLVGRMYVLSQVQTVWRLGAFLDSWRGRGWTGRYRRRAMPTQVANRLAIASICHSSAVGPHSGDGKSAALDVTGEL